MAGCQSAVMSLHIFWILTCYVAYSDTSSNKIVTMDSSSFCNTEVDLGSATVYSHSNAERVHYSHDSDCKVTFVAKDSNWKLMLRFEMLDIPDFLYNGVCTDGVYVYDDNKISGRTFRLAGANNGLCGKDIPPTLVSTGRYLTVYFRTDTSGPLGKGFKFQVTSFSEAESASTCGGNFYCEKNKRCINSEFKCDGIKQCDYGEDEEDNGLSMCNPIQVTEDKDGSIWEIITSMGIAGFIGIIVGALVVVILLVVCVVCTCRRCGKSANEAEHRQSIPSSTHGSVGVNSAHQMGKDGVAYHAVPQMAPQMNPHMMNAALNQYGPEPYGPVTSMAHQPMGSMQQQRPMYAGPMQQPPREMVAYPMVPQVPQAMVGYNSYNSPFHQPRGESHSYSSGYSSQQGVVGGGFQPMHTKPIMPQRGYTPTSGSSRSSHTESDITYSKGDNHNIKHNERGHHPVAL